MSLESFGIPDAPANEQALVASLQSNVEALSGVVSALYVPVNAAILANTTSLNAINKTLQKSLASRAAQNTKALAPIAATLRSALAGTQSANESALSVASIPGNANEPQPGTYVQCDQTGILGYGVYAPGLLWPPPTNAYGPFPSLEEALSWVSSPAGLLVCSGQAPVDTTTTPTTTTTTTTTCPPTTQVFSCPPPVINVTCPPTAKEPPPPPPPPPEPPPPEPVDTDLGDQEVTPLTIDPLTECGLMPDGTFPPIGSPEFCACLPRLVKWFQTIGVVFSGFLLTEMPNDFTGSKDAALEGATIATIGALAILPVKLVLSVAQALSSRITNRVREVWGYVQSMAKQTMPCDPGAVVGIAVVRAVVNSLHSIELGVNVVVKAKVDFDLRIHHLEVLLDAMTNYICPMEIPGISEAIDCYLRGTISRELAGCWMAMKGANLDVWQPLVEARQERVTPPELIQFLRRQGASDEYIATQLISNNSMRGQDAGAQVVLYDELPTISDHLHWLQRNVFDDEYVEEFRLMDGFADKFWPKFGHDLRALGMRQEYAALHYASHWLNPSPGQLREMVFRLRSGRVPDDLVFTAEQYQRVLAEQDVGPFFRPRFDAILYNVPALSYIRDMHRLGFISDDDLQQYHQDLGYSETDSNRFMRVDALRKYRMRASESHGWTPAALAKAFAVGQINQSAVDAEMANLGWDISESHAMQARARAELQHAVLVRSVSRVITSTLAQVKSAQMAGVLSVEDAASAIAGLGFPSAQASAVANSTDISMRVGLVKHATTRLRSAWLAGEITLEQARSSLSALGVTTAAVGYMLAEWTAARTPNRRRRSAIQYMSDFGDQALSEAETKARLSNLGYESSEIDLFFKAQLRKVTTAEEKEQERALKRQMARSQKLAIAKARAELHGKPQVVGLDGGAVVVPPPPPPSPTGP